MYLFSALEYCRYGMSHSSQKLELPLNSSSLYDKKKCWNPSTSFSHHSIILCTVILRTGQNLIRVLLPVKSLFFLCVPPFLLDCTAGCQDFWRQERVFHSHGLIKTVIIQLYSFFHSKPLAVQLRNILYYINHDDLSTLTV